MQASPDHLIPNQAHALMRCFAAGARPLPPMTVSVWADTYRRLPSKGASEPGRWRTDRVPFAREIMDCLSPQHPARRVVFQKAVQIAGTEVGNNWVGYVMHRMRVPMMAVQPTIDLAERWSKQRLAAMIEDTLVLREKIAPARSRDSGNTTLLKEWGGGVLVISGANSGASLRSMPARFLFADEVDAYPVDLDGEGDPLSLAEARLSNFPNRKVFICSTPTIKSLSVIDKEYQASDQRRYQVPCPHCGGYQALEWEQLHWPDGHPEQAVYLCSECGRDIEHRHKSALLAAGRWVAGHPERGQAVVGFHLNSLYSPAGLGLSWGEIATIYERVKSDPVRLKTWTNTRLGICTEDPEEKIDWEELKHRAEPYRLRSIPDGCLVLTAGVDVQKDRWEALILGHGEGGQEWVIDYQVIPGDPTRSADWQSLDTYLLEPIENSCGVPMRVQSAIVDAGYLQDDVIRYTHPRAGRHVHASKGASTYGKPIIGGASKVDYNWRGGTVRSGARLWVLGEDTAKARLFALLSADRKALQASERRLHFSADLDDSFYAGLTAEVYDPNKRRWIKIRQRNEPMDCYGMALAAAMHPSLRLHKWGAAKWQDQRRAMNPPLDLFSAAARKAQASEQPDQPAPSRPVPPRTPLGRGGRPVSR